MIIGVDHVLVATDDLELAIETYQALGFQVLRGGEHPGRGTYNALVPLADGTYLELMGVRDRDLAEQFPPSRRIVERLDHKNRLATFALDSDNLESDVAAIRERGLEIGDPREGDRTRPDGERVAWRTAVWEDVRLPFLLQDVTPRELRIPPPTEGIGRFLRLADVAVSVRDLEAGSAEYEKLLGVAGAGGRFELQRGAIQLEEVDADEMLLRVELVADDVGQIAETWREQDVTFRETVLEGVGVILEPVETAGAPITITGRAS